MWENSTRWVVHIKVKSKISSTMIISWMQLLVHSVAVQKQIILDDFKSKYTKLIWLTNNLWCLSINLYTNHNSTIKWSTNKMSLSIWFITTSTTYLKLTQIILFKISKWSIRNLLLKEVHNASTQWWKSKKVSLLILPFCSLNWKKISVSSVFTIFSATSAISLSSPRKPAELTSNLELSNLPPLLEHTSTKDSSWAVSSCFNILKIKMKASQKKEITVNVFSLIKLMIGNFSFIQIYPQSLTDSKLSISNSSC